jgi:hypothetical protein
MGIIINNSGSGTVPDGSITTAKIANGAVTPAKLSVAIQLNNPNYFKNPAFAVVQGTSSGTVPNSLALPTASLGYPGEAEWCIAAADGTPAYAFSTTNQTLTLTGATLTTAIYVLQRIESIDAINLRSKQVTLSVELSNSQLSTVTWELFRPTTANVHGTIASPTQTLVASGAWTVNSTLTRYSTTVTLPAEVSNGLEVRFRVGAQTSGTWVISRPKLEEGSSATAFVCGDYSEELLKCQRYYKKSYADGTNIGAATSLNGVLTYGGAGAVIANKQNFEIPFFAAPIPAIFDTNGNSNAVLTTSGGGVSTPRTPIVTVGLKSLSVAALTTDVIIEYHYSLSAHIP